jgi:glycerol-3-phosphate acyltransferase PlsX
VGLIEGFQVFRGDVDVVVCDGFVGNILLKTLESLIVQLKTYIKEEFMKSPLRMFGAVLSRGVFAALKERLNPETYGAASLLGLNGVVLKSHGSSTHRAIRSAMGIAASMAGQEVTRTCHEKINLANEKMG